MFDTAEQKGVIVTVTAPHPYRTSLELTLSDLGLPQGRWHDRLWVTDTPLRDPDRYLTCVAAHEHTGLWPVLIPADPRFEVAGEDWVADRGRLLPPAGEKVRDMDAGAILAGWWRCRDNTGAAPFGAEFPGLARRARRRLDAHAEAGNTGSVLAARPGTRLGLVRASRPADIPALIGWDGMINATDDVAAVSAVLRSWEDRFGATLVRLGFDTLELSVAAPPKTTERALAVAAEHRAFCADSFSTRQGGMREFAAGLVGTRIWHFWWG